MAKKQAPSKYLLCVQNSDYPASLELRKVYRVISDPAARSKGFVRVVDESGEDYLYPECYFVKIELPTAARSAFVQAS